MRWHKRRERATASLERRSVVGILCESLRHIEILFVDITQETARRAVADVTPTETCLRIREETTTFCPRDSHVEQSAFFFYFVFGLAHTRRQQVFFYAGDKDVCKLEPFCRVDSHKRYTVSLPVSVGILVCKQRHLRQKLRQRRIVFAERLLLLAILVYGVEQFVYVFATRYILYVVIGRPVS